MALIQTDFLYNVAGDTCLTPQRQFGCPFCLPGTLAEYLLFQNYTARKIVRSVLLKGILCQDTFQFGI